MKKPLLLICVPILLSMAGCGPGLSYDSSNASKSKKTKVKKFEFNLLKDSISYEIEMSGPGECTTGKLRFFSKAEFCEGLLDEDLNSHCALKRRTQMHERYCRPIPEI
jgi:hypothetical protein